jgi:hypothetical protein
MGYLFLDTKKGQGGSGKRTMKRFLILLALVLLSVSILAVYYRNTLLENLLCLALARAGMDTVSCTINSSGITHLDINTLQADLPASGVRFRADSIRLEWNSATLSRHQLRQVTIDAVDLFLSRRQKRKQNASPTPVEILNQAQRLLEKPFLLPFHHLKLHSLSLHTPTLPLLSDRQFSLDLDQEKETRRLQLTDKTSGLMARFALLPGKWSVNLATGTATSILQGTIQQQKGLSCTLQLALDQLGQLAPLAPFPIPPLQGTLTMAGSVQIGMEPILHLNAVLVRARFNDISIDRTNLQVDARLASECLILDRTSQLRINTLHNKNVSLASLKLPLAAELRWRDSWTIIPLPDQKLRLTSLAGPGFSLDNAILALPASIIYKKKQVRLHMGGQGRYTCTGLGTNDFRILQIMLEENNPWSLIVNTGQAGPGWQMEPGRWNLVADKLEGRGFIITPDPLTITLDSLRRDEADLQLKARVDATALHLKRGKTGLVLRNLHLDLDGARGALQAHGNCQLDHLTGGMELTGTYNLNNGKGKLNLTTRPSITFSSKTPLSSILENWPLPADLESGTLTVSAEASWPCPVLTGRLRIRDGSGILKDFPFTGLDTDLHLALLPKLKTLAPARITLQKMPAPVELHNLSTTLLIRPGQGAKPGIILRDSRVEVLGGSVENKELKLDLTHPDVHTTLILERLHIEDLLALQQVKGLAVNGIVSGTLPICYDSDGLRVEQGRLQNLPPGGVIRYTPGDGTALQSSPLTGIALKALEEFHYKLLSATTEYQPDGTLRVSMHLEGKSPKLDSTRPVHLNINTEQNVLSLLKSLRYSETLTDEIDKRIESHFHPDKSR